MFAQFPKLLLCTCVILISFFLVAPHAVTAQTRDLLYTTQSAEIDFDEEIVFTIEAPWEWPEPESVTLFYGLQHSSLRAFAYADSGIMGTSLNASYSLKVDDLLLPGTLVEFYWRIITLDGDQLFSKPSRLSYDDPSLPWSFLSDESIEIVWHSGGVEFGERVLSASKAALERLEDSFGVSLRYQTRIVIYEEQSAMRKALGGATSEWVGGQAISPFNIVVLAATPSTLELDLLLAHELTHIVVDQAAANPFTVLPSWIHEGLATINESSGKPRFNYRRIVNNALDRGALLSLRGLTGSFPASSDRAILAYAQSHSLLTYVTNRYGSDSIRHLLHAYRHGVDDDEAVRTAIGINLDQLEQDWLEYFEGTTRATEEGELGKSLLLRPDNSKVDEGLARTPRGLELQTADGRTDVIFGRFGLALITVIASCMGVVSLLIWFAQTGNKI
jgi:hypothetical protein